MARAEFALTKVTIIEVGNKFVSQMPLDERLLTQFRDHNVCSCICVVQIADF